MGLLALGVLILALFGATVSIVYARSVDTENKRLRAMLLNDDAAQLWEDMRERGLVIHLLVAGGKWQSGNIIASSPYEVARIAMAAYRAVEAARKLPA